VELLDNGSLTVMNCADPTSALREIISRYRPVETPGLPRFYGGAVGYLGYDMVRHSRSWTPAMLIPLMPGIPGS